MKAATQRWSKARLLVIWSGWQSKVLPAEVSLIFPALISQPPDSDDVLSAADTGSSLLKMNAAISGHLSNKYEQLSSQISTWTRPRPSLFIYSPDFQALRCREGNAFKTFLPQRVAACLLAATVSYLLYLALCPAWMWRAFISVLQPQQTLICFQRSFSFLCSADFCFSLMELIENHEEPRTRLHLYNLTQ